MKSIEYYNTHADEFIENTLQLDLSDQYKEFVSYLVEQSHILDLGCGSGRDSLYFSSLGFEMTSMDGSLELVNYCRTIMDTPVIQASFESFTSTQHFDGIWACASLLHVPRHDMVTTIQKYVNYLNVEGVFFMSFKHYDEDFEFEGRHFTCYTLESLKVLLNEISNIEVLSIKESLSAKGDGLKWVSAIIRRYT